MNGRAFKLGTFAKPDGKPFAAIVLDDTAIDLAQAAEAYRAAGRPTLSSTRASRTCSTTGSELRHAAGDRRLPRQGRQQSPAPARHRPHARCRRSRRPGKMFYAAQNFQEHVDEMIRAGMSPKDGPKFTGEKSTTAPYLFLKAPSCLAGANDDIAIPSDVKKVDWEAEIACVISKRGKRIKAERALDHVAGWMTTNDVSARDLQIRTDRPGLRSDWLNGKSHDKFAPMGPYLVPRAFVKDHMNLFIRLTVNGEVKQNGNTSQFIFTPEEQIEYASDILSGETGDIFVCGTCGGVGQGTNTFINVGDVMETEVEGLGKMRNKFVAEAGV